MLYQAYCTRCGAISRATEFDRAATEATIHRAAHEHDSVSTRAICPNCGQWRDGGDCVNVCASRGLADEAGPETLNL
jgi:hypothetical protein